MTPSFFNKGESIFSSGFRAKLNDMVYCIRELMGRLQTSGEGDESRPIIKARASGYTLVSGKTMQWDYDWVQVRQKPDLTWEDVPSGLTSATWAKARNMLEARNPASLTSSYVTLPIGIRVNNATPGSLKPFGKDTDLEAIFDLELSSIDATVPTDPQIKTALFCLPNTWDCPEEA